MKAVSVIAYCASIVLMHSAQGKTIKPRNLQNYMKAIIDSNYGNTQAAHTRYKNIFDSKGSVYTYKGYINLLYETRNYKEILGLIPQLENTFKDDPALQLIFAKTLEHTGQHKKASEKFVKLNTKYPYDTEIAFITAQVYINKKELENALHVIDKLLNNMPRKPNNFIFYYLKAQIYLSLVKQKNASEAIKMCVELHPHFDKGWLLFATLNEQTGAMNEAIKGYTTFLELSNTPNKTVEQHLLSLIFKQKSIEEKKSSFVVQASCFEQAMLLFGQKQYNRALKQVNKCLGQTPDDTETRLLKVQILMSMHKSDVALDTLYDWMLAEPANNTWYDIFHLVTRTTQQYPKAIAILEYIEKQKHQESLPILYLADFYTRTNQIKKAIAYHKRALRLSKSDKLKVKLLFHLSSIYYNNEQFNDMKVTLEECTKLKPLPIADNLLAYYYATKEKKFDLAQKFINKALAKEPKNAQFLDTQAIIYYKQKKYSQAATLFETIIKTAPYDYTILVHLGKTYTKLGKQKQAQLTLKEAKKYAHSQQEKNQCKKFLNQCKQKKA